MQNIKMYTRVVDLDEFGNDPKLEPGEEYTIVVDYPLNVPMEYKFKAKVGDGLGKLISHISKAYRKAYSNDNNIWGHHIDDLSLGGIKINDRTRKITLFVNS